MKCFGRRQFEEDASYHTTEVFDNNAERFSNPHMNSLYGWIGKANSTTGLIYITLQHQGLVSGIYHAGGTVGNIGVTKFRVKYSKSTPPEPHTFVHSAHSNATHSNVFASSGDDCKIEFSLFTTSYYATAFMVIPLEWKKSVGSVLGVQRVSIDAPSMRVSLEMCNII
jgi:hypothetical protein